MAWKFVIPKRTTAAMWSAHSGCSGLDTVAGSILSSTAVEVTKPIYSCALGIIVKCHPGLRSVTRYLNDVTACVPNVVNACVPIISD